MHSSVGGCPPAPPTITTDPEVQSGGEGAAPVRVGEVGGRVARPPAPGWAAGMAMPAAFIALWARRRSTYGRDVGWWWRVLVKLYAASCAMYTVPGCVELLEPCLPAACAGAGCLCVACLPAYLVPTAGILNHTSANTTGFEDNGTSASVPHQAGQSPTLHPTPPNSTPINSNTTKITMKPPEHAPAACRSPPARS